MRMLVPGAIGRIGRGVVKEGQYRYSNSPHRGHERGALDMTTRLDVRFDGVPKRLAYPVAGLLLAAGAPVGMLAVRALRGRHWSTSWLKQDIKTEWLDYLYVGGATAIAFALWGRLLGGKADDLIRM